MKLDLWATVSFHRDLDLMAWQSRGMLDEEVVDRLVAAYFIKPFDDEKFLTAVRDALKA